MKLNKLLHRQLEKFFPDGLEGIEGFDKFVKAVNDSYNSYERDHELFDRAFKLTEEEYIEVNDQLKKEIVLKKLSIAKLKESIREMGISGLDEENEDLIDILDLLHREFNLRKEAEKELTTTAGHLSMLISNMQVGILVEDARGNITVANQFFFDLFNLPANPDSVRGMKRDEFIEEFKTRLRYPDQFHTDVRKKVKLRKMFLNQEIELSDGNYFDFDCIPLFFNESFEGYLWKYRNITSRKKAEAALRASQELWQFALEGAGDGVWEYNFNTQEVYFSRRYKNMLGYEDEEFPNVVDEWWERVHPDDRQLITKTDDEYAAGTISSHQREYRMQHKNGEYLWILDRGMIINHTADGKPNRMVGTHTDITHRKLNEQALRINEEKYRNIIANMNLGLLEVDTREYIQYANYSFCEMSGFELEELIGKKASQLFTKGENLELLEQKNEMRRNKISDAYQIAVKNKRGELRWWLISGAPRYNDMGELVGSIGIHLDITDQKMLEEELLTAREAAEMSAKAKEQFLANMSHEIRTPMNAILGMGHQLSKAGLDPTRQFYLDAINRSAEHLLVVINDILDISKIEAGKLELEHIGFRLDNTIAHCLSIMSHRAEEKGLILENDSVASIETILLGDPVRMEQILLNLLSNAIKFTQKGGVVVSSGIYPAEDGKMMAAISVTDTGIGMDDEFMKDIFNKFSQEDRSIARKYGGTGLGMSICKQLTELMSGEISVRSIRHKGTTVTVHIPFPIGTAADIPQKRTIPLPENCLAGRKILLVEDNAINRLVATTILHNFQAEVTEAENGSLAVELLKKESFDAVLMDMQMPVMDGLEATRIIRSQLKNNIPIIALTANAVKGESDKCRDAGMNDFISKPFEEKDLIDKLGYWIAGASARNTPAEPRHPDSPGEVYDLTQLSRISQGNRGFVKKMINLFVENMPASVAEMKKALNEADYRKIRSTAHKIKPALDNMGISLLYNTIREIEEQASREEPRGLEEKILQCENVISQAVERMQQEHLSQSTTEAARGRS